MSNDNLRQEVTTSPDLPRQAATGDASDYSLSIEAALAQYEAAGVPRTPRSIQRYCAKGDLDAHRVETPFGDKFLITRASVDRHIAYINEVRLVATGRNMPRHAATADEVSRPVAADTRIIELLESENQFLREQVSVKDRQIAEQQERAHETNALVSGLQRLLAPLLSSPDRVREEGRAREFVDEPDQR